MTYQELYINACRYAVEKLVEKGSTGYCVTKNVVNLDGSIEEKFAECNWSEVLVWLYSLVEQEASDGNDNTWMRNKTMAELNKSENLTKKHCGCCNHWKRKGVKKIGGKPISYGKCTKISFSGFEVETTFNDGCSSEFLK